MTDGPAPLPRLPADFSIRHIVSEDSPLRNNPALAAPLAILAVAALFVIAYFFIADEFPFDVGRDVGLRIDIWLDWLKDNFSPVFQAIKDVIVWFLIGLEDMMLWLTWPAMIAAISLASWLLVSFRMGLFSASSLLLLATFGLWEATVETMALIIVTVTLSIGLAVPMGVWASQNDRLDAILRPILDGMQTMPSFVYLVPAIAFFSLGDTPAVFATLIYAVPPAVRLTNLGIRQLPRGNARSGRLVRHDSSADVAQGEDSPGDPHHHGWSQSNHTDGTLDGRHRVIGRCRRTRSRSQPRLGSHRTWQTHSWQVWESSSWRSSSIASPRR